VFVCVLEPSHKKIKNSWSAAGQQRLLVEGHLEVVKTLLTEGKADANIADNNAQTPLYWVSCNGHVEVVKALLNEGKADANIASNKGWTPLYRASYNGHVEVVKILLNEGKADANIADIYGQIPLYWASGNGHVKTVDTLICVGGACIDGQALDAAFQWGRRDTVILLIASGVDTSGCCGEERLALLEEGLEMRKRVIEWKCERKERFRACLLSEFMPSVLIGLAHEFAEIKSILEVMNCLCRRSDS